MKTLGGLTRKRFLQGVTAGVLFPLLLFGQEEQTLAPVSRLYAITNANIQQAPGRKIDRGTIIIRNGLIEAVGKGLTPPRDAVVIAGDSLFIYPGFIDGLSRVGVSKPKKEEQAPARIPNPGNPPPERAGIAPQTDVRNFVTPVDKAIEEWRGVGFTTAQVVPYGAFLPGSGAIIQLSGKPVDEAVVVSRTGLYSELSSIQGVYPGTTLGVIAKWKDLYRQAAQALSYESLYASNRTGLERPKTDRILEAFYPVVDKKLPVWFRSEKVLDLHRVLALQSQLGFKVVLANVKEGWDVVDKIKSVRAPVLLSLALPDEPKDAKKDSLTTLGANEKIQLEKRRADFVALYSAQAAHFEKNGVKFGFCALDAKAGAIPGNLRRMIKAGLSEEAALAGLTIHAAEILGVADRLGTIDHGKIANLVVSERPYFEEKSRVRYVFIDGQPFKIESSDDKKNDTGAATDILGVWTVVTQTPQGKTKGSLSFSRDGDHYSGHVSGGGLVQRVVLSKVALDGRALKYSYSVPVRADQVVTVDVAATVEGETFTGTASVPELGSFQVEGKKDPRP